MRISDWSSDVCSSDLKCCIVNDYKALIRGGMMVANANAESSDTAEPREVSDMMVQILDDNASIEQLQVVLMRLLISAHARCNTFLLRSEERRVGKECVSPGRSRW